MIKLLKFALIICAVMMIAEGKGQKDCTHTVFFNYNYDNKVDTVTVKCDSIVATPDTLELDCYNFGGWFTDNKTFEHQWDFNNPVTQDTILYAKWDTIKFIVTFNSNGGSAVNPTTVNCGDTVAKPNTPKLKCYYFSGWFTDNKTFKNQWNFKNPVTQNTTLYAKWDTLHVAIWKSNISTNTLICCVDKPDSVCNYRWNLNDSLHFNSLDTPFYTFEDKIDTSKYNYSVTIKYYENSCECDTTIKYLSSSTSPPAKCHDSEETLPDNPKIKLFPNPAKNELNIETEIENADVQIIEITGNVVMQSKITGRQSKINISGLKTGFYILILKNENTLLTSKFIVE